MSATILLPLLAGLFCAALLLFVGAGFVDRLHRNALAAIARERAAMIAGAERAISVMVAASTPTLPGFARVDGEPVSSMPAISVLRLRAPSDTLYSAGEEPGLPAPAAPRDTEPEAQRVTWMPLPVLAPDPAVQRVPPREPKTPPSPKE